MTREDAARVALLAYPPPARAARGGEMLGTMLDVSAGSRRRFIAELVDLTRAGLRDRATVTARDGARRLVADGLCLAAIWIATLDLVTLLAQRARGMDGPLLAWPSIALLAAALALALIGLDRLAGAAALVWTALRLPELMHMHPGLAGLAPEVLPLVCFGVLLLAPRRRAPDPERLGWLLVPGGLLMLFGPGVGNSPILFGAVALGVLLVMAFAVALLPTDPRLAIAGAVPLTNLAIAVICINHQASVLLWLALATAPAALVVAIGRTRQLRRRSAIARPL
jgi:hypothetical protein